MALLKKLVPHSYLQNSSSAVPTDKALVISMKWPKSSSYAIQFCQGELEWPRIEANLHLPFISSHLHLSWDGMCFCRDWRHQGLGQTTRGAFISVSGKRHLLFGLSSTDKWKGIGIMAYNLTVVSYISSQRGIISLSLSLSFFLALYLLSREIMTTSWTQKQDLLLGRESVWPNN